MTDQPHGSSWRGEHRVPPPSPDATTELPAVPGPQSWWARLDPAPRTLLIITAVGLPLLLFCGGLAALAVIGDDPAGVAAPGASTEAAGERPTATAASTSRAPTVLKRTVTETEEIPFEETTVEDSSLPEGTREVRTEGTAGERTITYEVTFTDGVETDKRRVDTEVTREPVDRVVAVGTKPPQPPPPPPEEEDDSDCHPSYTGACVPFASDVDCAGGSGDGPAYVRGPVRIVGPDPYDLDRDGDGVACEG